MNYIVDRKDNDYVIYFPEELREYFENEPIEKIEKIGKVPKIIVEKKVFHCDYGFGILIKLNETGTVRSDLIQRFINNLNRFLYFYKNGVRPKTKTKFLFKKWE